MWHDRCAQNAARKVDTVPFDNSGGRQISMEDLAKRGVLDVRKLYAEADHHAKYKAHHEIFEESQFHHASVWTVEE